VSDISSIYNIKAKKPHLFPPRRGGAKKRKIRENVTSVVTKWKRKVTSFFQLLMKAKKRIYYTLSGLRKKR
jgi:hypothetical protein